jgi:hypothetical protein
MRVLIYDLEVFAEDWLVVVANPETGEVFKVHNQSNRIAKLFGVKDDVFGGFNNKHYDDYIIQAILQDADNAKIKHLNDWIIQGNQPWEFPEIDLGYRNFNTFDLRDDLQLGLSLKAIEGHLGHSIVETGVDFDIMRKLTSEELEAEFSYCKNDVLNTTELYRQRKNYLDSKLLLADLKHLDPAQAIGLTNAKLTAAFLDAKKTPHNDEFEYVAPDNLKIGRYQNVRRFFENPVEFYRNQLMSQRDMVKTDCSKKTWANRLAKFDALSPKEQWYSTEFKRDIAGVPHVYAWGGLHGAIPNYFIQQDVDHKILTVDVSSYYPSLMIQYGFVSRNVPDPAGFKDVYDKRIAAKNSGNKSVANALKLVLNTTYGASKNQYNDLYDPRMANAVCITGQLFLTDLIDKLQRVESFELIQSNTDGIVIRFEVEAEPRIEKVLQAWEKRVRMSLERTVIKTIAQKDVNNYVMRKGESYIYQNGEKVVIDDDVDAIKTKGGYVSLFRGGDFKNDSLVVVHKAVTNYFAFGTPVDETINGCDDVRQFQTIAKTGTTYSQTVAIVNGKDVPVNRVNRVYAAKSDVYGTLYKVKGKRRDKIANLPDHVLIDNEGKAQLTDIDKEWYVELAEKRIKDYLGRNTGKEKKRKDVTPMVETKTTPIKRGAAKKTAEKIEASEAFDPTKLNLFQKIMAVRQEWLDANVQKTGVNRFAEYKYFELADIVPTATNILAKYHLSTMTNFTEGGATMTLTDADSYRRETAANGKEYWTADFETIAVPHAALTVKGMNAIQAEGAVQTYQRRYLYMALLDIVEQDQIDGADQSDDAKPADKPTPKKTASKKPATAAERKETKKELTGADGAITDLDKTALKGGLSKLRKKDADKYRSYINGVVKRIKAGEMTHKQAEDELITIGEKVTE